MVQPVWVTGETGTSLAHLSFIKFGIHQEEYDGLLFQQTRLHYRRVQRHRTGNGKFTGITRMQSGSYGQREAFAGQGMQIY
jgi:hypothetical protein